MNNTASEPKMDLVSVLERRVLRLKERYLERERLQKGAGTATLGRISELQRTIVLIKAGLEDGSIKIEGSR